jgi:hypothetical protein
MSESKIPTFNSIKEEAAFWDTHDITDYLDEMAVVNGRYLPDAEEETAMTIHMAPALKEQIETVARSYDIPPSSLIRMWLVEKVRLLQIAESKQ